MARKRSKKSSSLDQQETHVSPWSERMGEDEKEDEELRSLLLTYFLRERKENDDKKKEEEEEEGIPYMAKLPAPTPHNAP